MKKMEERPKIDSRLLRSKIALAGYDRNTLAYKVGVAPQSITNLLNGRHNPSFDIINGLYRALELTPEEGAAIFFSSHLRSE